ncbi:MAG TPA: hypothetical protein VH877_32565 [Polyangia bacterium]|nr:hypothetical protein [Polyangia bacterium]
MVLETIPAVLAWVPGKTQRTSTSPFLFSVEKVVPTGGDRMTVPIELSWDEGALTSRDPLIPDRARRMRSGKTAQREHVTELAAYGLAFVALSVLFPGRRVIGFRKGLPPDLLFDVTPGNLRGIEVAGRTRGGEKALKDIRDGSKNKPGKRAQLIARIDVAEAYLSLWCSSPRVGTFWQVKP